MNEPYEFYLKSADYVRARMPFQPELAVILGSSLGPFAAEVQNRTEIAYADIPNFPRCTVADHAGKLIFGELAGKRLVCLSGRFHSYEGYDFEQLTQPVRLLKLLGVRAAILTNAAGGVNLNYRPGDVMVISDHIKLNGPSPLRGQNVDEFGERFSTRRACTRRSCARLRSAAPKAADSTSTKASISSCPARSLKHQPRSAPSASSAAMPSACRPSPRHSPPRTAACPSWVSASSRTWPPA